MRPARWIHQEQAECLERGLGMLVAEVLLQLLDGLHVARLEELALHVRREGRCAFAVGAALLGELLASGRAVPCTRVLVCQPREDGGARHLASADGDEALADVGGDVGPQLRRTGSVVLGAAVHGGALVVVQRRLEQSPERRHVAAHGSELLRHDDVGERLGEGDLAGRGACGGHGRGGWRGRGGGRWVGWIHADPALRHPELVWPEVGFVVALGDQPRLDEACGFRHHLALADVAESGAAKCEHVQDVVGRRERVDFTLNISVGFAQ